MKTFENWYIWKDSPLLGRTDGWWCIVGHNVTTGTVQVTSAIADISPDGTTVTTRSGSNYNLGNPGTEDYTNSHGYTFRGKHITHEELRQLHPLNPWM